MSVAIAWRREMSLFIAFPLFELNPSKVPMAS
jgi:hypothetical protein